MTDERLKRGHKKRGESVTDFAPFLCFWKFGTEGTDNIFSSADINSLPSGKPPRIGIKHDSYHSYVT